MLENKTNMDEYNRLKVNVKNRIVIVFDGDDKIVENRIFINFLEKFRRKNITYVLSTRRHRTGNIIKKDNHKDWQIVRCLGMTAQCSKRLIHKYLCVKGCERMYNNDVMRETIYEALEKNNLHLIPQFILMACDVHIDPKTRSPTHLDMYTVTNAYCESQLNKAATGGNLEYWNQFYNALGYYAIISKTVKSISAFDGKDLETKLTYHGEYLSFTNIFYPKYISVMREERMLGIAINAGLLYNRRVNANTFETEFVSTTIAEFAVAKLLFNSSIWEIADCLADHKWSMVQYYLLRHCQIECNLATSTTKLWKHQIKYAYDNEKHKGKKYVFIYR